MMAARIRRPEHEIAGSLLERHGATFAEELGIDVNANTPAALYQMLVAALLMSARIGTRSAVRAARAVLEAGWTTPQELAATSWEERVRLLNTHGYARYDESTARMLGDTASLLQSRYRGDLRRLREQAARDPAREKELLKQFKGIGDVGADIFLREAQLAWPELYPYADRRVLDGAVRHGLPGDARRLAALVSRNAFPRLAAALIRARSRDGGQG